MTPFWVNSDVANYFCALNLGIGWGDRGLNRSNVFVVSAELFESLVDESKAKYLSTLLALNPYFIGLGYPCNKLENIWLVSIVD